MSQKEILAIAIKVFSLWFLCWLFIHLSSFFPFFVTIGSWQGHEVPTWVYFAICVSFIISGLIISWLLFSISTKTLDSLSIQSDISVSEENRKFIFQISGLFFIVSSLVWLPNSLLFLFYENQSIPTIGYLFKPIGYLFQCLIGAWLVIHPSWWALLFNKLRSRA